MTGTALLHADLQVGQRASFSKTITEADISAYTGLVGNLNPQHIDAEFARRSRYGQRTAPEMLAAGMLSAVLSNRLPGPASVYLSQQLEFLAPIFIGDTVTAVVEVVLWQPEKRLVTLKTECLNQEGRQLITGQAVLMVHAE